MCLLCRSGHDGGNGGVCGCWLATVSTWKAGGAGWR